MAISGSATTAYKCWLTSTQHLAIGYQLMIGSSVCVKPEVAIAMLFHGETVNVAGADIVKLRELLVEAEK
ncbi:MAG: hypothetical protein DDT21_02305 [Syntrophomonadaceae bacterium]|nr:hypothetical protein [Bacillota bacterium]